MYTQLAFEWKILIEVLNTTFSNYTKWTWIEKKTNAEWIEAYFASYQKEQMYVYGLYLPIVDIFKLFIS